MKTTHYILAFILWLCSAVNSHAQLTNNELSYICTRTITSAGGAYGFQFNLTDHMGNVRAVLNASAAVQQANDYFPFGLTHATVANIAKNKYLYNGKELQNDVLAGIVFDQLDYGARFYDPVIGRWHAVDPLAEKYFSFSPYNYCGNDPVNRIDPTGMDWYQNNKTKYYTWYDDNKEREGYSYIGEKGSVLGEFESIIDGILTDLNGFNTRSMYSEGFTFDIAPNDKGGLLASKERDWDFTDEFAYGVGPEFSVLLSDHPYTEAMKTEKKVLQAQQAIVDGETDIPGQITNVFRKWYPWNVFGTTSIAKQFIGSYRYDAFTSSDGTTLNNVISDSKSRSSFFLHLPISNKSRNQTRDFATTYQFYIWQTPKR